MPMTIRCPKCRQILQVADEHAGLQVRCPGCQTVLQLPKPATQPPLAQPVLPEERIDDVLPVESEADEDDIPVVRPEPDPVDSETPNPLDFSGPSVVAETEKVETRCKLPRIRMRCPRCLEVFTRAGEKAGTNTRCPECRTGLVIPNHAAAWLNVNAGIYILIFVLLASFVEFVGVAGFFSLGCLCLEARNQRPPPVRVGLHAPPPALPPRRYRPPR